MRGYLESSLLEKQLQFLLNIIEPRLRPGNLQGSTKSVYSMAIDRVMENVVSKTISL